MTLATPGRALAALATVVIRVSPIQATRAEINEATGMLLAADAGAVLCDEWVASHTDHATVAELETAIAVHIERWKRQRAAFEARDRLADSLAATVPDNAVPPVLLAREIEARYSAISRRELAEAIARDGFAAVAEAVADVALRTLKTEVAFGAVVDHYRLAVSDAEVGGEVAALARRTHTDPCRMRGMLGPQLVDLRRDLLLQKATDLLLAAATVIDDDGRLTSAATLGLTVGTPSDPLSDDRCQWRSWSARR